MSIAEPAPAELERRRRRRAALRVALRDGDTVSAARAWERLRVRDAVLTLREASAARAARAALGRAIRSARRRRAHRTWSPATETVPLELPAPSRAMPRGALVLAAATFLSLLAIVLPVRRPDAPAAAPPEAPAAATPEPAGGRGRVSGTVAPVAAAPATTLPPPAPSVEPTSAPSVAPAPSPRTAAPGGQPGGASGGLPGGVVGGVPGGVVGGTPGGAGTSAPPPSPAVNQLPVSPPPMPQGAERFFFKVIDSLSGEALANVCVVIGTRECGPTDYHTNVLGLFWLDVPPNGSRWGFTFVRDPDYLPTVTVPQSYVAGMGTTPQLVYLRRH